MWSRLILGGLLLGWLVFGTASRVAGQVLLDGALEDVAEEDGSTPDERFGDYVPISLSEETGPVLLAQIEDWVQPPGQTPPAAPTPGPVQPAPPPITEGTPPQLPPPQIDQSQSIPGPVYFDVPMPPQRRSCPPWRPCGPQESFGGNWWVKQGFAGADFRGACDFHDRCLLSGCTDRKTCDKMFLGYLDNACNCSAYPVLCRLKARQFYLGVRLFGWMY